MEKLESALCQWTVLYTNYFNFQFSYFHTFSKTNNIKTKPSTNVSFWTHKGHQGCKRMQKPV